MQLYIRERLVIVAILSLFYLTVLTFANDKYIGWTILFLFTQIIAFSHFIVGWTYQLRSFARKPNRNHLLKWFVLLWVIALSISLLFLGYGQLSLFSLLVIGYFMIHGFFNEITLYEKRTNNKANRLLLLGILFLFLSAILLSIGHPSSLTDSQFEYILKDDYLIQIFLQTSFLTQIAYLVGKICIVLTVVFLGYVAVQAKISLLQRTILLVLAMVPFSFLMLYPLNYILIFSTVLLYHFFIWFWVYFREFKLNKPQQLNQYIWLNLLTVLPFLSVIFVNPIGNWLNFFVLNSYVFLTLTAVHVTTSFMSERWFGRYLLRED